MVRLSIEEGIAAIQCHHTSDSAYPFFVAVDGTHEMEAVIQALPSSYQHLRVSNYCRPDSFPDYDRLLGDILESDTNILLRGLGECAMLTLDYSLLRKLKDQALSHKLVIICRNAKTELKNLQRNDSKFGAMRWCEILSTVDVSVVSVKASVSIPAINGFKALLADLETFVPGKRYVHTDLHLVNVAVIRSAYGAIRDREPSFTVDESRFSSDQWEEFLKDGKLDGFALQHWRTYLRMLIYGTESPYLRLVMQHSANYEVYSESLLCAILNVKHTADSFQRLYEERKSLLRNYSEHEIKRYIIQSRAKDMVRIHYLTNNTLLEKRAIVEEIAHIKAIPDDLPLIYPDLADYLNFYHFGGEKGTLLTEYFEQYKHQKVFNEIDPAFEGQVIELSKAGNRQYNGLPTRGKLLMPLKNHKTGLYWVDALGVEYLGFIQKKAKALGLRLNIHIGRASLPTLTSINRGFYDDWTGFKAPKEEKLDDLKHEGCGQGTKSTDPVAHLADELGVIMDSLIHIKGLLMEHQTEKMLLVSDHGTSRLCVLSQTENKWTMSEKGKHSGRCCPISDADECPGSATEEENFWVLANYDRFQGGRSANVEVHGGATLEEVVIPVIEIELATKKIECYIPDADDPAIISKPLDDPPVMTLFCSNSAATIFVRIKERDYNG